MRGTDLSGWPRPKPLDANAHPPFPMQALPGWLGRYVAGLADETQTPRELAGMLSLAALAAACAKRAVVEPRPNWIEPLSLWVVVVLGSGNRKTAVVRRLTAPIARYEQEWARTSKPVIAVEWSKRRCTEERLRRVESSLSKAAAESEGELGRERDALAQELAAKSPPSCLRLLIEDITPEGLASVLAEQGGRIALLSDEGGPFDSMAGRYSKNGLPNLDVWLKGDSGGPILIDRRGRPPESVEDAALTLGLAVQPDVIRSLADRPGFRGRGLLARFLYAWPVELVGRRKIGAAPIPTEVEADFAERIYRLLAGAERVREQPEARPQVLRLTGGATNELDDFARWLEPQLSEDGPLGVIQDWGSKLVGKVARIAALLHIAEAGNVSAAAEMQISVRTLQGAAEVGRFLIEHARTSFAEMGGERARGDARALLAWIRSNGLRTFSKRDAFNALRGRFGQADRLDPPIRLLLDLDYVLELVEEGPRGPGRPSRRFEVNAHVLAQNPQNTQDEVSADSADSAGEPSLAGQTRQALASLRSPGSNPLSALR